MGWKFTDPRPSRRSWTKRRVAGETAVLAVNGNEENGKKETNLGKKGLPKRYGQQVHRLQEAQLRQNWKTTSEFASWKAHSEKTLGTSEC